MRFAFIDVLDEITTDLWICDALFTEITSVNVFYGANITGKECN